MRASIKAVIEHYQIRKTVAQKRAFYRWLKMHALEHDYEITKQTFKKGRAHNLIIGDPLTAEVIVTAHYDTPPNSFFPIATIVGSIPMYLLSQILIFVPVVAILWLIKFVIQLLIGNLGHLSQTTIFLWFEVPLFVPVLLIAWCLQMMFGVANKKNMNDNTSGISVLLSLLEDLPCDQREKVCFVFFDEEEKGLEGAKVFKSQYGTDIQDKPLINFDCVGHGKKIVFIVKKRFKNSQHHDVLVNVTSDKALIKDAMKYVYASDQLLFKNSVGVAAVDRIPLVGFYLSRLHSRFDTKFSHRNIEALNQMMTAFITQL